MYHTGQGLQNWLKFSLTLHVQHHPRENFKLDGYNRTSKHPCWNAWWNAIPLTPSGETYSHSPEIDGWFAQLFIRKSGLKSLDQDSADGCVMRDSFIQSSVVSPGNVKTENAVSLKCDSSGVLELASGNTINCWMLQLVSKMRSCNVDVRIRSMLSLFVLSCRNDWTF